MHTENLHKTYASGPPPREGRRQQQAEKCISAEVAFPKKTEMNPYARINYSVVWNCVRSARLCRWRE